MQGSTAACICSQPHDAWALRGSESRLPLHAGRCWEQDRLLLQKVPKGILRRNAAPQQWLP